ncbi:hypothetical protein BDW66DRAFT_27075 [Aspergillus desertorum]
MEVNRSQSGRKTDALNLQTISVFCVVRLHLNSRTKQYSIAYRTEFECTGNYHQYQISACISASAFVPNPGRPEGCLRPGAKILPREVTRVQTPDSGAMPKGNGGSACSSSSMLRTRGWSFDPAVQGGVLELSRRRLSRFGVCTVMVDSWTLCLSIPIASAWLPVMPRLRPPNSLESLTEPLAPIPFLPEQCQGGS